MSSRKVTISIEDLLKMSTAVLRDVDYEKMSEIAETVSKAPALINDFDRDPATAARKINGFEIPAGFHMHIVDANNIYHPKENDALAQISTKAADTAWTRIETRAGYATIACVICLWCS